MITLLDRSDRHEAAAIRDRGSGAGGARQVGPRCVPSAIDHARPAGIRRPGGGEREMRDDLVLAAIEEVLAADVIWGLVNRVSTELLKTGV